MAVAAPRTFFRSDYLLGSCLETEHGNKKAQLPPTQNTPPNGVFGKTARMKEALYDYVAMSQDS